MRESEKIERIRNQRKTDRKRKKRDDIEKEKESICKKRK